MESLLLNQTVHWGVFGQ